MSAAQQIASVKTPVTRDVRSARAARRAEEAAIKAEIAKLSARVQARLAELNLQADRWEAK